MNKLKTTYIQLGSKVAVLLPVLWFALVTPATAQIVGQGAAGTDPWVVFGTVTFTNATINIGNLPTTVGTALAVRCVNTLGTLFESCGGSGGSGGMTDVEFTAHLPLAVSDPALTNLLTTAAFQARINTLGQKTMANSTPVTFASDQSALPVSGTITFSNTSIDITDRAARLLGVVYGSQGQQLKQTATNFNLASELHTGGTAYDARQIRALTGADIVTANQGGAPWSMTLSQYTPVSGQLPVTLGADVTTSTPAPGANGLVVRNFPSGVETLGAGSAIVGKVGIDQTTPGTTNRVDIGTTGSVQTKFALTGNAPATTSVGVASASAVAANASRKGLVVVNLSNATVCLGLSAAAAVLNSGLCLQPGAVWTMNEYTFNVGAINAIASAAASTISIQEFQ